MRMKSFDWLGREFVAVSCEGGAGLAGGEGVEGLLGRIEEGIAPLGFSLEDTVRTRLWGRDRESRNLGSQARSRRMRGAARSASSSYIAPDHLDSGASVALDFLAMRSGGEKKLVEYDPPVVPLRYLELDSLVFLSGVTATTGGLSAQVSEVCGLIGDSLAHAGTSWDRAALVSFYLQQEADPAELKDAFERAVGPRPGRTECTFVEGYSAQGKLIEIEVTAERGVPGRAGGP